MLWIGFILTLFIMACMVTLALVMYSLVERMEKLEEKTEHKLSLLSHRINVLKKIIR